MASHPSGRSSSSPATSGCTVTAMISLSLTYPNKLQLPRHMSAQVDCEESRLWMWDKRILPWLKTRLTSVEVAIWWSRNNQHKLRGTIFSLTWNCKVVEHHTREVWIHRFVLVPPQQNIFDLFRISTEVACKFVTEFRHLWCSQCRQFIEDIALLQKSC